MTILHATIGSFIVYIVLINTFGPAEPTKQIDGIIAIFFNKDQAGPDDLALDGDGNSDISYSVVEESNSNSNSNASDTAANGGSNDDDIHFNEIGTANRDNNDDDDGIDFEDEGNKLLRRTFHKQS